MIARPAVSIAAGHVVGIPAAIFVRRGIVSGSTVTSDALKGELKMAIKYFVTVSTTEEKTSGTAASGSIGCELEGNVQISGSAKTLDEAQALRIKLEQKIVEFSRLIKGEENGK